MSRSIASIRRPSAFQIRARLDTQVRDPKGESNGETAEPRKQGQPEEQGELLSTPNLPIFWNEDASSTITESNRFVHKLLLMSSSLSGQFELTGKTLQASCSTDDEMTSSDSSLDDDEQKEFFQAGPKK